ncbi:MAG: histidinol dehydrogenase [Acidimicrobiia bacterium]|nr:histidinol dehydrogenase [Acidimicrobiia bacterium]
MLTIVDLRRAGDGTGPGLDLDALADRAGTPTPNDVEEAVRGILADVRDRGDAAVRELTERFDGCRLETSLVDPAEAEAAWEGAGGALRGWLEHAARRIRAYHEAQAAAAGPVVLDSEGVRVEEVIRPVERAGLYVPGGRAAYPSTVLMTAVPAAVAGVGERVLCVPPGPDGAVAPPTLAAARLAGVEEIHRIGGAQAVAAMAYGTGSIRPVDVVVGPGNAYVDVAKRLVAAEGVVGIDGPAGPSEVVVVADASVDPAWVAADLAAQAEHGPGGTIALVAWDESVVTAVGEALDALVAASERHDEIRGTLAAGGTGILVAGEAAALAVVNRLAPEHLQLMVADPESLLGGVRHAGAVFCGAFAPAALGDYAAGANHVLPTGRSARFSSALRVDTFRRHVHVVRADPAGAAALAPVVSGIARAEGLVEHARAAEFRAGAAAPADPHP